MSLLQENGSSLASIIKSSPEELKEWASFRLLPADPLVPAQLHTLFWGKSMAEAAQKWRDDQLPMPAEGTGLGNSGDEPMDVDVSEEDDDVDDIIEGCHFLELGIEDIPYSKIWIRAEYIRIYNAVEDRYGKRAIPPRASAVVITGQPGIGKSVWIFYALRRRLADNKPFIWYFQDARYLFVEEGVYKVPNEFQKFKVYIWTFVDSDNSPDGLPAVLRMQLTRHFSIYCTSPNQTRWSYLHKIVNDYVYIMNPWKRKEIFRVVSTLPPDTILDDDVNRVFDELGPTPRLCIDYLGSEKIEKYREAVREAISKLTTSQIERLFQEPCSLTMDEMTHKLCLISRQQKEDVYSNVVVTSITTFINSRLSGRLRSLARAEQIRLYKDLSRVRSTRVTAGIFFEAAGQGCLRDGVTLGLLPMVQLPHSVSQGKGNPQWYSSHIPHPNKKLEEARQLALKKPQVLKILPGLPVDEYAENGPSSIIPSVIYVPELDNQVALNSFILVNDVLYIFQFTIGAEHDIKSGLFNFIHKCPGSPPVDKWCFVFIHPPNHTLICPQPQKSELQQLVPYSAQLDLPQPDVGMETQATCSRA